jgi:hypothetical protein
MSHELDARERRAVRFKASAATLDAVRALGGEAERRAIVQRALADGGFTRHELAAPPPPAAAVKFPSMVDYQLSWALTNLKRDGLLENPARSVWRLAGAALQPPELALDEPVYVDRLEELERMDYREYLRTPEWRQIRAAALVRAGDCCSLDVTHTDELEVHHRDNGAYARRGRELASDLVVLCHACHGLHHKANGRPGRVLSVRATAPSPPRADAQPPAVQAGAPPRPAARPRQRSFLRRLLAP